jgi:hypothetical protein
MTHVFIEKVQYKLDRNKGMRTRIAPTIFKNTSKIVHTRAQTGGSDISISKVKRKTKVFGLADLSKFSFRCTRSLYKKCENAWVLDTAIHQND